jgi:hypothetical protein
MLLPIAACSGDPPSFTLPVSASGNYIIVETNCEPLQLLTYDPYLVHPSAAIIARAATRSGYKRADV